MIRTIGRFKIIFSLVLLLYVVFILNSSTFAEQVTVTCYPKNYTIHNYKGCASGYPTATINDGHADISEENIDSDDVDEVWYYTIPNYKSESISVNFKLYGPVTEYTSKSGTKRTYVKNLYVDFTDTIPANTIRMYFYTVFTADKSYEASEIHSVDISLNSSKVITGTSNFRSLVAVSMGDDGETDSYKRHIADVVYHLNKEEIENTRPTAHHYGYPDESANPHYIQFLYPDSNRAITLHSFVQSGARPIGTPVGNRAYIVSSLSGFNGYEVYTIYSSTSKTHYYSNGATAISNAVTVNSEGKSEISRETLGHLVITYDKQDKAPDLTPPDGTVYTDIIITNQNTIRVYASVTDDDSGVKGVVINGFYGATGGASFYTGGEATYAGGTIWYRDFTFSTIPHLTNGWTNNGDGYYRFDAHPYDNAGNYGYISPTMVLLDQTPPGVSVSNIIYPQVATLNLSDNLSGVQYYAVTTGSNEPSWQQISVSTSTSVNISGLAPGTYYAWAKDVAGNINRTSFTVGKGNNTTLISANDLTYNAQQQQLVSVSNVQGTVYYSMSSQITSASGGSTTIPTRMDANTYIVYWFVSETDYYNSNYGYTYVTIKPYDLSIAGHVFFGSYTKTVTYDTEAYTPTPSIGVGIPENGNYTLTKDVHFTFAYENNTNAGTATVKVVAKSSNYKNYAIDTFTINQFNISNATLSAIPNEEYNMRAHTPNPVLKLTTHNGNEKRLTLNSHYTCSYTNNINAGTATVTIYGAGSNVFGSRTTTFTIVPYDLSKATIGDCGPYTFNMRSQAPTPTVTVPISPAGANPPTALTAGTEFTFSYGDTINATQKSNNTWVMITAKSSNYTGSKTKYYVINQYSLTNATIGGVSNYTYDATAHEPRPGVTVPLSPAGANPPTAITEGVDFNYVYSNNINAGTATLRIKAVVNSNYKDEQSTEFTIYKYDITPEANATVSAISDVIYDTLAYTPEPRVTVPFRTAELAKNVEIKYTYDNNINASVGSNKAIVTISAVENGNFTGSRTVYFTILPYNLANAVIADIAPEEYNMRQHTPSITVTANMYRVTKTLSVGTEILCTYGENINVGNDQTIAGYLKIIPNTVSPHNTNYTGEQEKNFTIYPFDLSKATIADVTDTFTFDTLAFKPEPVVTVPISPAGHNPPTQLTKDVNFKYTYVNNIHAGTATVIIETCGDTNYKGNNSIRFTINPYDLANATIDTISDLIYKMEQHTPTPTVTANMTRNVTKTLTPGTDFIYKYGENTDVGNNGGDNAGWVQIEPKNTDYTGSQKVYFNIRPYDLANATIADVTEILTYDTLEFTPTPTVTVPLPPNRTTALTKNVHFVYSYTNNIHAGTATITISSCHTNYTGTKDKDFTIHPYDLAGATIDDIPDEEYNTLQHTPEITVTSNMTRNVRIPLRPGIEITCTYGENINVGNDKTKAGTVTITPGSQSPHNTDYTNSQLKYFTIEPYSLTNAWFGEDPDNLPDRVYNERQHRPTPLIRVPIPTPENPTTIVAPTNFVFEYGANVNAGVDAGSVTVKATPNDTNYKESKTVYFTIQKRPVVIPTAVEKEYYYNGNEQTFEVNDYDKYYDALADTSVSRVGLLDIKNNKQIDAGLYSVVISIVDKNNNMWKGTSLSKMWSSESTEDKKYPWRINKIDHTLTLSPDGPITIVRWNSKDVNYTDTGEGTVKVTSANPGIATIVYENNERIKYGDLNRLIRSSGKATITGVAPGETLAKYDMEETTNYFKLQKEVPIIVLEAYYSITNGGKTIYYNKLEDALEDAVDGDTIKVIKDATETTSHVIDKKITLDLMNNTITSNGSITISSGIDVSIIGKTKDGKSGGIENTNGVAIINNGTLTLDKSAGDGIICAPFIKGTNLAINSSNGIFNFYDGKLIGSTNLPYTGTAIYKPRTYIYTYKEGNLFISILKIDNTPPIITGEKPDKSLINVGTDVRMNVNITEPESGIRTEEFTEDDLKFFVGETEVTPSYIKLSYGFEYNGIYRYLLEFRGITGNGMLKIKVAEDKVFNLALLGNPEATITDGDIKVDNTSATLQAEIRLVNPTNKITTDGNYEAEITRVSDENRLRDYEWEMKGPDDNEWRTIKIFNIGDSSSHLIGTVLVEGLYRLRVKVTDTIGNKAYSNVVEFEYRKKLDYNAKPTISFEKEIVNSTEVIIHAIVKSTTKLVSAKVNGNAYSDLQIEQGETVEGTWQVRTELEYTANVNTMYKFEVTDSQNNTTTAIYAVTDISRKEANIDYKIVDATAFEKAKIVFRSQEDVLLVSIPDGFKADEKASAYGRDFTLFITEEVQIVNEDFNFVNDLGTETIVHIEGNVETIYRNIRNVPGVISELNSVKELKDVYGVKGVTYERAKNLVLRMKNAKAVFEGTIKSYYGTDSTEINMRVSSSNDISVAKILGGASSIQVKSDAGEVIDLEKGNTEIITSAERGQMYSSNDNRTGIYFKEEYLVEDESSKGNSFHVTITNK